MRPGFRLLVFFLCLAAVAEGHDIEATTEIVPPAVIVKGAYGGSEPVAYASVLVFAPAQRDMEFQNGRTDARGVFSFVPDRPGEWLVVLDDETGHRSEVKVNIGNGAVTSAANDSHHFSRWQRLLSGISWIVGLTGIFLWYKSRRLLQKGNTA
jgi:nickel transport protein